MSEPIGSSVMLLSPVQGKQNRHDCALPWGATWTFLLCISAIVSSMLVIGLHSTRGFFVPVLAMVICTLAAILDAYTRRIPNHLTYTAILAGLAINALASACTHIDTPHFTTAAHWLAAPGITQSLLGFGVCAALGLFGVIARIGGGDIKLLAALGALMGLANIGAVLIVALSAALVYALLNLALSGRLNTFIQLLALRALELLYFRRFDPFPDSPEMPQAKRHDMIPMAVPLALGLIVAQLLDMKSRLGIGS